jgi:GTP1/Obg family GTP-binding protein
MLGFRAGVVPAAMLATAMALPAAAQQLSGAPSGAVSGANMSDATVKKVGAALRQVAQVEQTYSQRLQSANTPEQKQDISKQASGAAVTAITQQGLTIDQYNQVIQAAQSDPALKQRVLAAAGAGR